MKNLFSNKEQHSDYEILISTHTSVKGIDNFKSVVDTFNGSNLTILKRIKPTALTISVTDNNNTPLIYDDSFHCVYMAENFNSFNCIVYNVLTTLADKLNKLIENDEQFLSCRYIFNFYNYKGSFKEGIIKGEIAIMEKNGRYFKRNKEYTFNISFNEVNTEPFFNIL